MKRRLHWPSFDGPPRVDSRVEPESASMSIEDCLRYISGYPTSIQNQVRELVDEQRLGEVLISRYPEAHEYNSNKLLRGYTHQIKSQYLKTTDRLSKVCFDDKLHLVHHALGTQTFVSLAHGGRLKARRELRVSSLFKRCPEPLLRMIVVHELAHLREKSHNQAFYRLCLHMEPHYHRLELDARLYLIHRELFGTLYER